MKKQIYEELFNVVPARKFFPSVISHYGKAENVSEADRAEAKKLVDMLLVDSTGYKYVAMDNPLIDVPDLIKSFTLNYNNSTIVRQIMNNPNFNSLCMQVILAFAEKYPDEFFESDYHFCTGILTNLNVPEDKLREYAKSSQKFIRITVARNPNCPRDVFEALSNDRIVDVIREVAYNPSAPVEILERLAGHRNMQVRKHVAYNRSASEKALRTLAETRNYELVKAIVRNPNCPVDVLEKFASYTKDAVSAFFVRLSVATNPNLSEKVWEILLSDPNPMLRNVALASKICPIELLKSLDWKATEASRVMHYILERDDLPSELVMDFAENYGSAIRAVVVANAELPQEFLLKHANDRSKKVRFEVSRYLRDNDALIKLIVSDWSNVDFNYRAVTSLGAGSSQAFLDAISRMPNDYVRRNIILSYIGNDKIPEDEMWHVFNCVLGLEGDVAKLANDMLYRVAFRENLSEESIEKYIAYACASEERSITLHYLVHCNNFYSRALLDICNALVDDTGKLRRMLLD